MASPDICPRCSAEVSPEDLACPHCGAEAGSAPPTTTAPAVDAPPDLPPRYEPKLLLGWGGMGRVYLCRDTALEVDVAVKVLRPEIANDARKVLKIETEAKASARLRGQPGILGLYGFESHGATRYLVMEYAAGGSVFQRLRDQGKIPEAGCRRLGAEIAEALAAAHERGVIHRDIKPANVLLDISGRTKVADFGLAHLVSSAYGATSDAPLEGTPVYMPPEAFLRRGLDGRSDLYSLGVVLYEMATGEPPFRGSVRDIAAAKTAPGAAAPDPRALRPNLSPEFSLVVRKLLDADPARRFPDAKSAAAALRGKENLLRDAAAEDSALSPGPSSRSRREAAAPAGRPSRAPWVVGVGVALLAAAGFAFALRKPDAAAVGPSSTPAPAPSAPGAALPGILVVTKPAGADIFVDGRLVGRTAGDRGLRVVDVDPDVPHTITAELADHEPDEEKGVVWKRGVTRAPLAMKLVPKVGVLEIEGGPPGARVSFLQEGKEVKQAAFREDGSLAPEMLPGGTYELVVTAPRFHPWKQTVKVGAGRNPRVVVAMAEMDGFLSVDSVPQDAAVLVDGKEVGRTPILKVAVAAGKRRFVLQREDVAPAELAAEIRGERMTDLGTVTLDAMSLMDTTGLPEGVTALLDDNELKGVLRRAPGPVTLTFRRAKSQPQSVTFVLKPGPNPPPKLAEWIAEFGYLDLRGLEDSVDGVSLGTQFYRKPWSVLSAAPGYVLAVFVRSGHTPVPLRVQIPDGVTVKLAAPEFGPYDKAAPPGIPGHLSIHIDRGVDWLVRHQDPAGFWSCEGFAGRCRESKCQGAGTNTHDVGVTGLSLLAILGQRAVEGRCDGLAAVRGLDWLVQVQVKEGQYAGCYGTPVSNHFLYDHAMATLAMVEGYRVTQNPVYWASIARALRLIEQCRNPGQAWRYGFRPKDNDTSATAWMVHALRAGADIGQDVEEAAFRGALAWLDAVTEREFGRAGYTAMGNGPARPEPLMEAYPMDMSEALTAAAITARLACGQRPAEKYIQVGLELIRRLPPIYDEATGTIDFYYWYLGTRAIQEARTLGDVAAERMWTVWLKALVDSVAYKQRLDKDECNYGSWDAVDPWKLDGGRVYSTAINVLSLEVPFRHATGFKELPGKTTLSIASDPPGALVFVGGWFQGSTPLVKLPISTGEFPVRLEHPERGDYASTATIPAYKDVDLGTIVLPQGATLDLADLPRDAVAVIQGREVKGKAPVRPGTVEGTILRPGYFPQRLLVEARAGETVKPESGEWKVARDWPKALFQGLPVAVPSNLDGVALPAGIVVHEGRLWSEKDRVEMVLVPGLPAAAGAPAAPAFLADRHEVTVAQFLMYCKASGDVLPIQPRGSSNRHPVVRASYSQAVEYARWAGKRLPSIAEWQRAAVGRPVEQIPPPCPYPWGTWHSPRAHNSAANDDGSEGAAAVGSYPLGMSCFGVLDLVGNVAERLGGGLVTGNSYLQPRQECYRSFDRPNPESDIGFRCVMDLPTK